jgi:hypothetical protein
MYRAVRTVYYPNQKTHNTFPRPYILYINSLQDYTCKTVQIVYAAIKQANSTCYN